MDSKRNSATPKKIAVPADVAPLDTIDIHHEFQAIDMKLDKSIESLEETTKEDPIQMIADYKEFQLTMKDPDHMQPLEVLLQNKLEINKWNNIPVPLVNASTIFELSFKNTSRILKTIIKDQQTRFNATSKQLQKHKEKKKEQKQNMSVKM